jgi:glycosyltransferase involved in cell wall biosynthesis
LSVPPLDVNALAEALRQVLADRALNADLVAKGRARASRFSWADAARQTAQIYGLAGEDR